VVIRKLSTEDVHSTASAVFDATRKVRGHAQLDPLALAFGVLVPQLNAEDAASLAQAVVEALKGATDSDQLNALAREFTALVPRLKIEDARSFLRPIMELMQTQLSGTDVGLANALAALCNHLAWSEQAGILVAALKYPTVYGESRSVLVKAIAARPEATNVNSSNNGWELAEWLKTQPGIDLSTPPQRTRSTVH
jgi:hypothetical protein